LNGEGENKLVNQLYADLLVKYDGNAQSLERYGQDNYTVIDERFAVINIPVSDITQDAIKKYGITAFPTCYGLLDTTSLDASGISRIQNIPSLALSGKDVLIGVVDTGIEYTNSVFKNADNTTKIVSIWDQNIQSGPITTELPYGTEYSREQINQALSSKNPLSTVPSTDENGHGTMIAGIAAGARMEAQDFRGVVPDAELVIVKLKAAKQYLKDFFLIPNSAVCYQDTDIMFGVRYLINTAKKQNKPIAICVGLGTNSGFNNGRDPLSDYLAFVGDAAGTAVVIAAGNEGNRGSHYYGIINGNGNSDTFELKVGKDVQGFSMELWGFEPNVYSVDILSPSGEFINRIQARIGESREIDFIFENTILYIDYQLFEVQSGQLIFFRLKQPTEGVWRFRVYGSGNQNMDYHVWLPMEKFITPDTFFLKPNPDTTVTSPGNTNLLITVTTYDHTNGNLYIYASRGYTTLDQIKPDFAAPGVNVYGPGLNNTFTNYSGSSVAAAHTVGVAGMLLEWGVVNKNLLTMSSFEIRNLLISGAKRDPKLSYPNKEWGYGKLDLYNSFLIFRSE
jgi:Subtilisin-like serine proteases